MVVLVMLLLRRLFLLMVLLWVLGLETVAIVVVLAPLSTVQHRGISIAAIAPSIAVDWRTSVSIIAFCTATGITGDRRPHSTPAAAAAASIPFLAQMLTLLEKCWAQSFLAAKRYGYRTLVKVDLHPTCLRNVSKGYHSYVRFTSRY